MGKEKEIRRPALKLFLKELKSKIIYAETFDELEFPEYEAAWNEWKEQLNYIEKAEDKLLLLKCLEIETNQSKRQIIGVYKKNTACDILQSEFLDN